MILGAILPNNSGDKRTTLHPDSIKPILDIGIDISFESGLCKGIDLEDSVLENLGAKATDRQDCIRSSDILFSKSDTKFTASLILLFNHADKAKYS